MIQHNIISVHQISAQTLFHHYSLFGFFHEQGTHDEVFMLKKHGIFFLYGIICTFLYILFSLPATPPPLETATPEIAVIFMHELG